MIDATQYDGKGGADAGPRRSWTAPTPFQPNAATSPAQPLAVFLNQGRWVVNCPDCNSAQYASYDDPRFMCSECANVAVGNLWRTITWPPNRAAIEAAAARRPVPNMNWLPGETVGDLIAENAAHGMAD